MNDPVSYIFIDDSFFQTFPQNLTFRFIQGDSGRKGQYFGR